MDGFRIRCQIEVCFKHLKANAAPLGQFHWGSSTETARQLHWGNPFRRPNSGGVLLRQDSKICLMVALVVMAYILSIQQGLEKKIEKKKIYGNKPSRLAIFYFRQGLSIIKAMI